VKREEEMNKRSKEVCKKGGKMKKVKERYVIKKEVK